MWARAGRFAHRFYSCPQELRAKISSSWPVERDGELLEIICMYVRAGAEMGIGIEYRSFPQLDAKKGISPKDRSQRFLETKAFR